MLAVFVQLGPSFWTGGVCVCFSVCFMLKLGRDMK